MSARRLIPPQMGKFMGITWQRVDGESGDWPRRIRPRHARASRWHVLAHGAVLRFMHSVSFRARMPVAHRQTTAPAAGKTPT